MNIYKIRTEKDGKADIEYVASTSLVTALAYGNEDWQETVVSVEMIESGLSLRQWENHELPMALVW